VPAWATDYARRRAALLARLGATLRADERFVAAWLTGSFGRGEEDACSDVDCTAVVAGGHADALLARPWRSAGRTTAERLALLRSLGRSAVVLAHDAHGNAPEGGTHTNALYADGTRLDLTLVPAGRAWRPEETRLLFERAPSRRSRPRFPSPRSSAGTRPRKRWRSSGSWPSGRRRTGSGGGTAPCRRC
jgi:hypothetical protein